MMHDDHMDTKISLQQSLLQCQQDLAFLQQLTRTLAITVDTEDIVKVLFKTLPSLIDADVIGVSRVNPHQIWTWAKPHYNGKTDVLQGQLREQLDRLGSQPGWERDSGDLFRRGRSQHLTLVPKSAGLHSSPESRGAGVHEARLRAGSSIDGFLYIQRNSSVPFTEQERLLLDSTATVLALALGNAGAQRQLQESHFRDPLTGVFNAGALKGLLRRELHAGYRYGVPACLIVLDLDYFAVVNERLGHEAGDTVLKNVAALVEDSIREVDSVSRYDGEAFAVVLPHTGLGAAQTLAERIRAGIERKAFEVEDGYVRLTTSIGLAACHNSRGESVGGWIADAECALNEAKVRGRNCVVTHATSPLSPARAALRLVA